MKKITLLTVAALVVSISSCKKDRVCECTYTHTSTNGTVSTDPNYNTTYKSITKADAKTICQKSTDTYVDSDGHTTVDVYDCKLK